jgi:hypothetical protein
MPDIRLSSPSVEPGSCPTNGIVAKSYASGKVSVADDQHCGQIGGLVGENEGIVRKSFATGEVSGCYAGGLVGLNVGAGYPGIIKNSYATGAVKGTKGAPAVGGLVGATGGGGTIKRDYSTGAVTGGTLVGGLVGENFSNETTFTQTYWDTTTSGISNLSQGVGNIANEPGISGLTTAQFQSGLPMGFHKKVWAEASNINSGFPYLINNPPPK